MTRGAPPPADYDRLLVVKLADFGDMLLATPALRALRTWLPDAHVDVLTTPTAGPVVECTGLADRTIAFEHRAADRSGLGPGLAGVLPLARRLRKESYDAVALLHHLTTRLGALKHAALVLATGAPVRAGMDRKGGHRGWFLTHRATDRGFDAAHEVDAYLSVAEALGARAAGRHLAFRIGDVARQEAEILVPDAVPFGSLSRTRGGPWSGKTVALHAGSGPYSLARRWPADRFAVVAGHALERGARVVLVGTSGDDTRKVAERLGSGPARARSPEGADDEVLDLTDRTGLELLGAVLARADALVSNDSGVMHLATAVGTPVVAVFGPSNDIAWGPWAPGAVAGVARATSGAAARAAFGAHDTAGPGPEGCGTTSTLGVSHRRTGPHHTVSLDLPCRPCFYTGHELGAPAGCTTRDCLSWLRPAPVCDALDAVLAAAGTRERRAVTGRPPAST